MNKKWRFGWVAVITDTLVLSALLCHRPFSLATDTSMLYTPFPFPFPFLSPFPLLGAFGGSVSVSV
jgi:hypothetical protein